MVGTMIVDALFCTALSADEKHHALSAAVFMRYGITNPHEPAVVRLIGRDMFTHYRPSTLARALTPDELCHCLVNHIPEFQQFLLRKVDLDGHAFRIVMDHEGAEWLVFNDSGVNLPADDTGHAGVPPVAGQPELMPAAGAAQ